MDGKKGNTKGVIGPKERAKVGGAGEEAIMTGKKIRIGMSKKREDRGEKKMIGGKRGERKGKCDPSIGEGGGGGVKRCKKGRMKKERGSGGGIG